MNGIQQIILLVGLAQIIVHADLLRTFPMLVTGS
jgi:hypothetical protein